MQHPRDDAHHVERNHMAEKKHPLPSERIGVILSGELAAECDRVRAELRARGVRVSFSGLVDVALRELTGRRDLADVLRRHGAKARRD